MPRVPRAAPAGIGKLCSDTEEEFWGHDMVILGTISSIPSLALKKPQALEGSDLPKVI